jgi:hypothetical protein
MISLVLTVALAFGAQGTARAEANTRADVRFFPASDETSWVGEKRDIHLELWTSDVSFSSQSWVLPDVPGAFLMQLETGSVNLTETRNGTAWQGLRYTLSLYPQRAGEIDIPSFEVRFSTREGYRAEPVEHRLVTPPISVEAWLPEGVPDGAGLVATSNFKLDVDWQPAINEGEPLKLKTGDALVLDVKRTAKDLPSMVFLPLQAPEIDGLGVYSDRPRVNDRVNRGSLSGERLDRITFVCEQAGNYQIPEMRFQWWDPSSGKLHEERIEAVTLEVEHNPAWGRSEGAADTRGSPHFDWRVAGFVLGALALAWPLYLVLRSLAAWLRFELKPRRLKPLNPGVSDQAEQ